MECFDEDEKPFVGLIDVQQYGTTEGPQLILRHLFIHDEESYQAWALNSFTLEERVDTQKPILLQLSSHKMHVLLHLSNGSMVLASVS